MFQVPFSLTWSKQDNNVHRTHARQMKNHTNNHLLQKIVVNMPSNGIPLEVKVDVHVLAKATGVVIAVRFGIAESFQDDVGQDEHIFHSEMCGRKTFLYKYCL